MWTSTAWLFSATALSLGLGLAEPEVAAPSSPPVDGETSSGAPVAAAAEGEGDKLRVTVAALQQAYEGTKDFQANFTQRYTYALLRRTQESKGTVRFKKPGLMRWDYEAPTRKSFIVDGKRLWVHQPEDSTAMVDHCFKQDGLTASVAFLWGAGKIEEQFTISWFDGVFGEPTDLHLALEPKQENSAFKRLILVVDPASHRVKQSVVVDVNGNVNQFLYDELKFNSGLKDKSFTFEPPKSTHVSRIPGSCDPGAGK